MLEELFIIIFTSFSGGVKLICLNLKFEFDDLAFVGVLNVGILVVMVKF
jgi:ABC-type xylose transport system permease subunit